MTDTIREALQNARDWFDQQADVISKGSGSTWDLLQVHEQRDLCDAALSAQPAAVAPKDVELAQGPDDKPRLLIAGREVAVFPAGSWTEACEMFDFGGYRKQPAAVDGMQTEAIRERRHQLGRWRTGLEHIAASCEGRAAEIARAALAPQHVAVDAAPTYRLLSSADEIRADDEFLGDDTVTWLPVGKEFLSASMCGKKYNPSFLQPMRRTVAARPQPHGEA